MFTIRAWHEAAMHAWCDAGAPYEACGLLIGDEDTCTLERVWPCRAAAPSVHSFKADDGDVYDGIKYARAHDLAVLGGFHSHTNGKWRPSAQDMLGVPDAQFVIVIVTTERITAWRAGAMADTGMPERVPMRVIG